LKNCIPVIFFLILGIPYSKALDAPAIECITINAAGEATIVWDQIADPGGQFVSYELRRTTNFGGIPQTVTTINNIGTTSFVDLNANANAIPVCYTLVTNFNDGSPQSTVGETVCGINLIVTQSVPVGQAIIHWNQPWQNNPPNAGNFLCRLYMEYPAGTWTQIFQGDYSQLSYFHEVSTCSEFLNFRIELEIPGGCTFVSNLEGDNFQDNTYPVTPIIYSVQVDSTSNLATVQWLPSISPDTYGYIVYQCVGAQTLLLDTVWGINTNDYTFLNSVAGTLNNEAFVVAAFDSCFAGNPPTPNTSPTSNVCHRSIFLTTSWFPCETDVTLSWNPFNGWTNGIDFYEVWVQINGTAPQLLATLPSSAVAYIHENIQDGLLYKYFVKAHSLGETWTSLSNGATLNAQSFIPPAHVYLSTSTVLDDKTIEVKVNMAATGSEYTFFLERTRTGSQNVTDVDFQQHINVTDFVFTDNTVQTDVYSYQYRISYENQCGNKLGETNAGKTILAQGIANSVNASNTLTWSAYSEWDGNVQEYRIHRSVDGSGFSPVGSVPSTQLFFQDDVYSLEYSKGEFCYIIEAIENLNSFGFAESSKSNEICVTQEPLIWIPSAFTANGLNPIFKPVIRYADYDRYTLAIFDIWGTEIFRSNDFNVGWNGEVNGTMSKEGLYMYYIGVGDGFGSLIQRRGSVMLLVDGN